MNTISRRKTKDERRKNDCVILSDDKGFCRRFLSSLVWIFLSVYFTACDFHGPWEYYPEERDVYTGIYTYGYVMANGNPYVCFSKVYQLDKTSSQNFAFYDSADVTVRGRFTIGRDFEKQDTIAILEPKSSNPNCFYTPYMFYGITGESYELKAYFKWDSAGHVAKSTYKAIATIPNKVQVKGMNVPHQNGDYVWTENRNSNNLFYVKFLEYPMDMEFVKVALDYDNSVRGVLSIMNYGIENGESQNTTMNRMFKGMTDADEEGYRGIAMHDPLEKQQNLGFSSNRAVAGNKTLDTLYLMNMMLPIGEISVDLYATDESYVDYVDKVKQSVSDSRFIPESNIENGMGVFSGMAKTTIYVNVYGEGVGYGHIAASNCTDTKGDNADSWDSRGCRLYQDIACAGVSGPDYLWQAGDLEGLNEYATEVYRDSVYNKNVKACYASHVKAAMMLDTTKWSQFLPDSIDAADKANAYADGLKRYCVANNFKNNHIADCSALKQDCLEDPERNYCKEYLWLWCADRGWNLKDYEQCRSAFVSRYYLQNLKSNVLHREVEKVCDDYYNEMVTVNFDSSFSISMCKNWCEVKDGRVECQ